MEWKEFSAKTVDDAILEAAIQLGTTRDKVEYEVISKGSSGFLGIGSKNAVIRARSKDDEEFLEELKQELKIEKPLERKAERRPEKKTEKRAEKKPERKPEKKQERKPEEKPAAPAEKPVPNAKVNEAVKESREEKEEKEVKETKPKSPIEDGVVPAVEEFLKKVFEAMGLEVNILVTARNEDRELSVELSGQDMGVLIGKRGQTLDSLQYLTSLIANKGTNEYIRVKVDTENYRERRKETLENLAKNISFKVKRTRKPVTLEPMNPYERRIIHSALQNDKFVSTHSEGEEPYRHVVVTLKEGVKLENNYRRKNNYNRNKNYKKRGR